MTMPQLLSAPPPTVLGCTDRVARLVRAETDLAIRVPVATAPALFGYHFHLFLRSFRELIILLSFLCFFLS